MPRLLLYEINTRCWLRQLSRRCGREIQLGNVPDSEFDSWRKIGVTHLWLMGVWSTGPKSRQAFLDLPDTESRLRTALPDWAPPDVVGSPYAISSYSVPEVLGGETGLQRFRTTLNERGIKLILDFVPNHLGLDHPWLSERPEFFVQGTQPAPGLFPVGETSEQRWLAHGKDPYFPAWVDTAQLDLRLASTQEAVVADLRRISERCDGVRCDMAMLALSDIFESTWRHLPPHGPRARTEFWIRAITAVHREEFQFIAEAYWDLEPRLLDLGFDFTYDKRVTDFIVNQQWGNLRRHLANRDENVLRRSIHFLENHDEPRIASQLTLERHALAAFLMSALPGMWLVFDGQLQGAALHAPVQLARTPDEAIVPPIATMYEKLLAAFQSKCAGHSTSQLIQSDPIIAVHWEISEDNHVLALINGEDAEHQTSIELPFPPKSGDAWSLNVVLIGPSGRTTQSELDKGSIKTLLPPESFELIAFCRIK
ncbi:MAG: alpha-amylase [Verrucomicrobia bacterium]|nr:alpha-amylase [Verrucomicrobiota bacterium]